MRSLLANSSLPYLGQSRVCAICQRGLRPRPPHLPSSIRVQSLQIFQDKDSNKVSHPWAFCTSTAPNVRTAPNLDETGDDSHRMAVERKISNPTPIVACYPKLLSAFLPLVRQQTCQQRVRAQESECGSKMAPSLLAFGARERVSLCSRPSPASILKRFPQQRERATRRFFNSSSNSASHRG